MGPIAPKGADGALGPLGSFGPIGPIGPLALWFLWPVGPGWGGGVSAPCRGYKRASREFGGGANSDGDNKLGRRAARSVYE